MMLQKILQVGNSAALTIPRSFLKKVGWKVGDELIVEGDIEMKMLVVKDKKTPYKSTITPEFKSWLDGFVKKNKVLLTELAKKW